MWIQPVIAMVCIALCEAASLAAERKSRVVESGAEEVWTAAAETASQSFSLISRSERERKLRFRTGPMKGHRFEVNVIELRPGKTRIDVELLTNYYNLDAERRDAWRSGDRYLDLVKQRVQGGRGRDGR